MNANRFVWALCAILIPGSLAVPSALGDWPNWRGPDATGSITAGNYPQRLDADYELWRVALPGKGCSTPIVLEQQIFVTAPVNGLDALLAIDWSGNRSWSTTFGPEDPGKHRNGSGSNASPVTDGDAVFVYFKSGTLAAVELNGQIRWQTNLVERFGKDTLYWDHGTSPVLTKNHVVMARMHEGDSWLAGLRQVDRRNGLEGGPQLSNADGVRSWLHHAAGD